MASTVLLATAGYDHTIKLWDAPSGIPHKTLQHPESQVNKLEITPDKLQIAAAGNPSLRLFDIATGSAVSYDGHTNNVTAVGFQKDGRWFFTGSEDGTIKIWDVRAPGCPREYESGCPINSVAIHPNQSELISGDRDGNIRVWDLRQNACSAELVPDGAKAIRYVSVAQDATLLAAANDHGSVFVWRLGGGGSSPDEKGAKFEPLQKLQAHSTYITKCLISPDCKRLATTSADHSIKIWDTTNNFVEDKSLQGHQRWVWDAVFSADSAYLVTASSDQTARLWDVAQGETIRHYTGHHKAVTCVALHDRPASEPPA